MKNAKLSLLIFFILLFLAPLKSYSATWSEVKPLIVSKLNELKATGKVGWTEIENSGDGNYTAKLYSYKANDKLFRAYITILWYDGCCNAYQNFYFTYYADGSMICNRTQSDYYHVLNDPDHNKRTDGWVLVHFHWEYNGAWSVYPTKGYLEADPNPYLLWNPNDPSRPAGYTMRLYDGHNNVYYNYFDPWNLKYKPKAGTGSLAATYVFTIPGSGCNGIEIVWGGSGGDGTTLTSEDCNYIVNNAPGWEYGSSNNTVTYNSSKINLRAGSFSYKKNNAPEILSFDSSPSVFNPYLGETTTISGTIQYAADVTWNLEIGSFLNERGNGNSVSFLWDGKDSSGKLVPPGTYPALLTATIDNGCTDQKTLDIVVKGCEVQVTDFTGSDTVISPETGGTINFSGNIESQQDLVWTIEIAGPSFAGRTVFGSGPSVVAEWDGKDENGKVAEPGLYTATLTASDINGECSDTKEITFTVEPSQNSCALLVNFGSSANVASGNLSHSQTLFSTKTGGVALHYNSLDGYDGPLGTGWGHSYDIFLKDAGSTVTLREGDGHRKLYTLTGDGYTSQPGDYSTLVKNADGGYTLFKKDGTRYDFGADGKVASITDRNGGMVTFAYEEGMLVSVADQYGRTTGFRYGAGRLAGIEDPAGNVYSFTVGGLLASVTYPDGGIWSYQYDDNGFMLAKTDPAGYTTRYEYDSKGRAVRSTDPEGGIKSVEYPDGAEGVRTTTVVEKDGGVWRYTYDTQAGTLTGKTDPMGGGSSYTYDASGNMLTRTEPDGSATSYAYDSYGNTTSVTDAAGQTTNYTYNMFGQVTSVIDPEGNATVNEYDARGNLVESVDVSGAKTVYTYDGRGNRLTVTDNEGWTTTYTYDEHDNVLSITDPAGATTTYSYDSAGNRTGQTDPNGATTYYEYDNMGRLVKTIDPAGNSTSYTYDVNGNRVTLTDANGGVTYYVYNYRNQVTKAIDPLGNETTYTYGGAGCASCGGGVDKLTSVMDPAGNTTRYEYDRLGRLVREIDPLGNVTSYTYDANGNVVSKTDPAGRTTTTAYDAVSRPVAVTDPLGGTVRMSYNYKGLVTSVTDAGGNTTAYEYDAAGRVVRTVSPDAGTASYEYMPDGRLKSKTDANGTTVKYVYDGAGRLSRISFPDSSDDVAYSYDSPLSANGRGRLTGMSDASGATIYHYDLMGRTVREVRTVLSVSYTTAYEYAKTGAVSAITYPSGRKVDYAYDKAGSTVSVGAAGSFAGGLVYDPAGRLVSMTFGNGLTQSRTYDAVGRVSSINVPGVLSLGYGYDLAGNITSIADGLNPASSRSFSYDALDRLAQATGPWGRLAWTYDANGNRLTQSNGVNYKYTYEANRLTSIANGHVNYYQYDNSGNTTTDGQRSFIYNQNQRLIKAVVDGKTVGEYTYDGKGRRVIKKTGPASTNSASNQNTVYHYDLSGKLIEETSGDGKLLVDYVYLNGSPLAMVRKQGNGEETFFYHNDHLGTPKIMTDKLKKVVWNIELDPFGNEVQNKGRKGGYIRSVENNLRFPGQYYDAETGLHYNWHRDYDPKTGRYVEADPIGINLATNHLYVYVNNNPLNSIDSLGLRELFEVEKYALGIYFGGSLKMDEINLEEGNDWSPYGNQIRLQSKYFRNNNPCNPLRLEDAYVYGLFAHEALHIWQRQHGISVTLIGAALQALYKLGIYDPYNYNTTITDPEILLDIFIAGNIERQGQMFQDYVETDQTPGGNVSKFRHIADFIKAGGR